MLCLFTACVAPRTPASASGKQNSAPMAKNQEQNNIRSGVQAGPASRMEPRREELILPAASLPEKWVRRDGNGYWKKDNSAQFYVSRYDLGSKVDSLGFPDRAILLLDSMRTSLLKAGFQTRSAKRQEISINGGGASFLCTTGSTEGNKSRCFGCIFFIPESLWLLTTEYYSYNGSSEAEFLSAANQMTQFLLGRAGDWAANDSWPGQDPHTKAQWR
jgi:hypothetical protein